MAREAKGFGRTTGGDETRTWPQALLTSTADVQASATPIQHPCRARRDSFRAILLGLRIEK
jgi:hypothetical protein